MAYPSTKVVSKVDEEGYFLSSTLAHISPLEANDGVYNLPAGTVDLPPPTKTEAGKVNKLVGGCWELVDTPEKFKIDLTALLSKEIMDIRNNLLRDSDFIVAVAYEKGVEVPQVWKVYRESLRNITMQKDFPTNVSWPTKPNKVGI